MNDGGPAFPAVVQGTAPDGNYTRMLSLPGMSLRDLFAATVGTNDLMRIDNNAHQKELFGEEFDEESPIKRQIALTMKVEAFLRYRYADAMLAERDKPDSNSQSGLSNVP